MTRQFQTVAQEWMPSVTQQIQQQINQTNAGAAAAAGAAATKSRTLTPWPFVTMDDAELNHGWMQNHTHSFIKSLIIAPLVSPPQWKQYNSHTDKAILQKQKKQHAKSTASTFLRWDDSYYGEPTEPLFVPWQQWQPRSSYDDTAVVSADQALDHILQDWYGASPDQEGIWDNILSLSSTTTTTSPVLLLRSHQYSNESRHDYLLQPLLDNVLVRKRRFRRDQVERRVVAVVALQFHLDHMLKQALQKSFMLPVPDSMTGTPRVFATLEDSCGTRVSYSIPIHPTTTTSRATTTAATKKRSVPEPTTIIPKERTPDFNTLQGLVVSEHILLADTGRDSPYKFEAAASSSKNTTRVSECFRNPGLTIQLHPTSELELIVVAETYWNMYCIAGTWIILYVFVTGASTMGLLERKRRLGMQETYWKEQRALEEMDPEDAFSGATVAVLDIAGWEEWMNVPSRSPCEVQSFLTSLLYAMDRVASEYDVVKIQVVGSAIVYASGQPNHVLNVTKFARGCFSKMPHWTNQLASTYGPATRDLQFTCGLDHGILGGGFIIGEHSTAHITGNAMRTATRLESMGIAGRICLSKNMANILGRIGKGKWVLPNDELPMGEEIFWLDTRKIPSTDRFALGSEAGSSAALDVSDAALSGRHSSGTMKNDSSHKSLGSSTVLVHNQISAMNRNLSATPMTPPNVSRVKRQQQPAPISPPPLASIKNSPPPPIAQIDVTTTPHSSSLHSLRTKPQEISDDDLGYEEMEPQTYEHDDSDKSADASMEKKQLVIEKAEKKERLIEWSVDVLTRCIEEILAARVTKTSKKALGGVEDQLGKGSNILEQCKEYISIPVFSKSELQERAQVGSVSMTDAATTQLRDYVSKIAAHYHDNAFHNFEHAANVAASMRKLFNKLAGGEFTRPQSSMMKDNSGRSLFSAISVGQSTSFGIKTDPIIKFSIMFCALVHDVDHPGVTNNQLAREKSPMALVYKRSIAEQNSVEFSWSLLMRPEYVDLRSCIYSNEKELRRFRQIMVNCIMATDLLDEELQTTRKVRWAKAFSDDKTAVATVQPTKSKPRRRNTKSCDNPSRRTPSPTSSGSMLDALRRAANQASSALRSRPKDDSNRKGTVVLEYLLIAADISHTMQHWKVYLKWNERLFDEFYEAYEAGRSDGDPSVTWYQQEIFFFDTVVIPLAKKLVNCGVLGDSADELLENAFINRDEWELQGHKIIKLYLSHYEESHFHQRKVADGKTSTSELQDGAVVTCERTGAVEPLDRSLDSLPQITDHTDPNMKDQPKQQVQNQEIDDLCVGDDTSAPQLTPGTAGSSVDGTATSDDGEENSTTDPDVVYAVLENVDAPDDFDSYILITPSEKRKREAKEKREREAATKAFSEKRRRVRRAASSASGISRRASSATLSSIHSRRSLYSASTDSYSVASDCEGSD